MSVELLISFLTIAMMISAGQKIRWTWFLGIINQSLWLYLIVQKGLWGLIVMNVILWIVYIRNAYIWMTEPDLEQKWRDPSDRMPRKMPYKGR